jgi:hypothetical protein
MLFESCPREQNDNSIIKTKIHVLLNKTRNACLSINWSISVARRTIIIQTKNIANKNRWDRVNENLLPINDFENNIFCIVHGTKSIAHI